MRTLSAVAVLALIATAPLSAADAADWSAGGDAYQRAGAVRAAQYVVHDGAPGNGVRAYGAQPWQNRHYYPFTGKKPKVGRLEKRDARGPVLAPTYYQEWSTLSLYPPGIVMPPPDNTVPVPIAPVVPIVRAR